MKIIDLLVKIANGEDVPKYIKYRDILKHKYNTMMVCKENIVYQLDQCVIDLNDTVEILEEEKKMPEKLEIIEDGGDTGINDEYMPYKQFRVVSKKINEIIDYLDYLKSKGDE